MCIFYRRTGSVGSVRLLVSRLGRNICSQTYRYRTNKFSSIRFFQRYSAFLMLGDVSLVMRCQNDMTNTLTFDPLTDLSTLYHSYITNEVVESYKSSFFVFAYPSQLSQIRFFFSFSILQQFPKSSVNSADSPTETSFPSEPLGQPTRLPISNTSVLSSVSKLDDNSDSVERISNLSRIQGK